jgi:hypothetical protein
MSTSPALTALRARRDALGLKRLEVYVHPDDWPAVKKYAEKAQRRRAALTPQAGEKPAKAQR